MVFSSIPFIFRFLPIVLAAYYIVPAKLKNAVLFVSSMVFYAWGEPKFALVMLGAIAQGYIFGILIEKSDRRKAKFYLALSVCISLAVLGVCKYADFFIGNFALLTGVHVKYLNIALPIGISFYTFQLVSYVADVYRGDVPAQRSFVNLGAYIAMFPQLIAGPIVRYSDIRTQLTGRSHTLDKFALGLRRFTFGIGKKIIFANSLGLLCETFKGSSDKSVLFFWLYAVAYTLQVYFDFSGYSDMAIGLAKLFGFELSENFDHPYASSSVTEFWRRWHISLGTWFRDYVYIPLGGNRVSRAKWIRNIFVVWFCTGFWHGAAWNFIVWGLFFGVLLAAEKLWFGKYIAKTRVLCHVYTLLAVTLSFVVFDSADMKTAAQYILAMFGGGDYPLISAEAVYYLKSYAMMLVISALGSLPLAGNIVSRLRENGRAGLMLNALEPFVLLAILVVSTAYLVDGSFNPFLYFRF